MNNLGNDFTSMLSHAHRQHELTQQAENQRRATDARRPQLPRLRRAKRAQDNR